MLSAHLAAEMDLATRLDRKLMEVGQRLEAQKSSESGGSSSQAGAGKSEIGRSEEGTEISMRTAESGGMDGRAFAKMEWDVLMGKEVII